MAAHTVCPCAIDPCFALLCNDLGVVTNASITYKSSPYRTSAPSLLERSLVQQKHCLEDSEDAQGKGRGVALWGRSGREIPQSVSSVGRFFRPPWAIGREGEHSESCGLSVEGKEAEGSRVRRFPPRRGGYPLRHYAGLQASARGGGARGGEGRCVIYENR